MARLAAPSMLLCSLFLLAAQAQMRPVQQRIANGLLEGSETADGSVRIFKGVPYAAAPLGALRWKAPAAPANWSGVRQAKEYAARCMQAPIYSDMIFHDAGPSEDCLYLNLWIPAQAKAPLPVMVWIHGGGFAAGATSEPRQDGVNLAKRGAIVVSLNYRLGIFGFFAHPELARESGHNAAGNYGLMDQVAALQWVRANIAAFGGDPGNVTIFGESAGSFSVSALMASPMARGLFHRAIGESGAYFCDTLPLLSLEGSAKGDAAFARASLGTDSLEALRAKPASEILQAIARGPAVRFIPNIDGQFLPESVAAIFAAGKQAHVPLLAGWNADEGSSRQIFGSDAATVENLRAHLKTLYGAQADAAIQAYAASTDAWAKRAAQDLASDRFIAFGTWKWIDRHIQTGGSPVYRYHFEQPLPPPLEPSVPHASEIPYVFEMLASSHLAWRAEDRKLSAQMAAYWVHFAKSGDPNGEGLPQWPVSHGADYQVMHLNAAPAAAPDGLRARYLFLDSVK